MIPIFGVSICGQIISILIRPIYIVSFSSDAVTGRAIFDFFILLVNSNFNFWKRLQFKTYGIIHYFTYEYNNICKRDKKSRQKQQWLFHMTIRKLIFSKTCKTIVEINFNMPIKYEKRLLLICIHHFDSDVINNMDHMRISGT